MTARDQLLEAWRLWDQHAGDRRTANRMVDAVAAAADELGMSATELRRRLAADRRAGHSHEAILDQIWSEA